MQTSGIDAQDRLIVALDLPDIKTAQRLVDDLDDAATFFKVGLVLQMASGTEEFVRDLIRGGKKVFLDYKYYDIAETMKKAVARVAELGVSFLTIHGTNSVVRGAVAGRGSSDLKLFTVTVLTNLDKADIAELGYPDQTVEELVLFRARKALEAGCDGVIASGREARAIKTVSKNKLLVVTPGIRPDGYPEDDQKRTVTPAEAVAAGADYLVVGRPITGAPDPKGTAKVMAEEMQRAFDTAFAPA